jgi:hypothetical protein
MEIRENMLPKFWPTILSLSFCGLATAGTFTPSSPGVYYAINDKGFYTQATPIAGTYASAGNDGTHFLLSAGGPSYSDAGVVFGFLGNITLKDLNSVTVEGITNPAAVNINIWLDNDGDSQFFQYTGNQFQNLGNDLYGSFGNVTELTPSTALQFIIGTNAVPQNATLEQLQAQFPNDAVAIWVGITNAGESAAFGSVDVATTTPEPGTCGLMGGALTVLAAFARKLRRR